MLSLLQTNPPKKELDSQLDSHFLRLSPLSLHLAPGNQRANLQRLLQDVLLLPRALRRLGGRLGRDAGLGNESRNHKTLRKYLHVTLKPPCSIKIIMIKLLRNQSLTGPYYNLHFTFSHSEAPMGPIGLVCSCLSPIEALGQLFDLLRNWGRVAKRQTSSSQACGKCWKTS